MGYFRLLRPHQWIKNFFVFLPIFFSGQLLISDQFLNVFYVFIAFSLTASTVYIFNDLIDEESDAKCPAKSKRPIPSKQVSRRGAYQLLSFIFVVASLFIYSFTPAVAGFFIIYLFLNFLYSLFLKHVVFIDIIVITSFYLLRVMAGGFAISVNISSWLIVCTFFVTLFLIIAKRKSEFQKKNRRRVFEKYNETLLGRLLIVSASLTVLGYIIYAIEGSPYKGIGYSVFFVVIGMLRYLFLASFELHRLETPEKIILKDKILLSSIIGWILFVFWIIYR